LPDLAPIRPPFLSLSESFIWQPLVNLLLYLTEISIKREFFYCLDEKNDANVPPFVVQLNATDSDPGQ
jgi:hypothetical protein